MVLFLFSVAAIHITSWLHLTGMTYRCLILFLCREAQIIWSHDVSVGPIWLYKNWSSSSSGVIPTYTIGQWTDRALSTAIKYNDPAISLQLWKSRQLGHVCVLVLHSRGTEWPLLAMPRSWRTFGLTWWGLSSASFTFFSDDADHCGLSLTTGSNKQLCAFFPASPEAWEEVKSHRAISVPSF